MYLKQSRSISFIARILTLVGVAGFSASQVWAQADAARISNNLAPVGSVCMVGEPCTNAPGVTTPAQPVTSAPAPAPVAAAPAAAAPAAPAANEFDVAGTYQLRCFACHGTGAAGAPVTGNAEAWGPRMANGIDAVLANAINGVGAMPPRGLCMDCTDDQLRSLITYMVEGQ